MEASETIREQYHLPMTLFGIKIILKFLVRAGVGIIVRSVLLGVLLTKKHVLRIKMGHILTGII
jgi:hypothetical protein